MWKRLTRRAAGTARGRRARSRSSIARCASPRDGNREESSAPGLDADRGAHRGAAGVSADGQAHARRKPRRPRRQLARSARRGRALRRARAGRTQPGYALRPCSTLGLGIGANTAIFSVINGVLLKPLPYEHGDRLVLVQQSAPLSGQDERRRRRSRSTSTTASSPTRFDGLVEFHQMNFDLLEPRRARPRQHRRRLAQLLRRARHQADPRPHLRRRRRRARAPRRCWCSATPTGRPSSAAIRTSSARCSR